MLRFSANIEASFLKTIVVVGPMPPVAANTNGEKQALSTSLTRTSYARLFHVHEAGNNWTIWSENKSSQKG